MLLAVASLGTVTFSLIVALLLTSGVPPAAPWLSVDETSWLAASLSTIGGLGAPLIAWLVVSKWDIQSKDAWRKAFAQAGRGGLYSLTFFAAAMVVLRQWVFLLLIVGSFAAATASGLVPLRAGSKSLAQEEFLVRLERMGPVWPPYVPLQPDYVVRSPRGRAAPVPPGIFLFSCRGGGWPQTRSSAGSGNSVGVRPVAQFHVGFGPVAEQPTRR